VKEREKERENVKNRGSQIIKHNFRRTYKKIDI
jgi:hypothetical protein